jgi:Family of unknown function (DUF6402)
MSTFQQALLSAHVSAMRVIATDAPLNAKSEEEAGCFKDFQLVEIPEVMEHRLNAPQGADLMRHWFNSPSFSLPESWRSGNVNFMGVPANHIETNIVKMSWVASFPRAIAQLNKLEQHYVNTPNASRELKRVLLRQGLIKQARLPIGTSSDAVVLHETAHLNSTGVAFGRSVDPLDCALASFTLHMAVSGFVEPTMPAVLSLTHEVEITKLHFYVRDCYDFTTDKEQLGFWSRGGASASLYNAESVFVENKSFRDWRSRHRRGGDFVIFSDVMTKVLPIPIRIFI